MTNITATARMYSCVQCNCQITICPHCDRGNRYCGECAPNMRAISLRKAGSRYQKTLIGKQKHADRQKRYRAKAKEKVTRQGSTEEILCDLLKDLPNFTRKEHILNITNLKTIITCHYCSEVCSQFIRLGPLKRKFVT